jgi:glycosyltransferase involved in cell wall biosynthesis
LNCRKRYQVDEWDQRSRVINLPALVSAVKRNDLVFGWFASWHTLFPAGLARILKRPMVLVVGGYDTANLPEIQYGSQRKAHTKYIANATMHFATCVSVFSRYSYDDAVQNAGLEPSKMQLIYLGVPHENYSRNRKEKLILTVSNVDRGNLQRKGLEPFVRAASLIPEWEFAIIGAWRDDAIRQLQALASPNVRFTGWLNQDQLRDYFSRAAVYVQASRHEGFGLAVAEAMLHECVPVVTRVGALPEVVDQCGVYIDSPEPSDIADGVRRAMTLAETLGPRARERIMSQFPLGRRGELLYQTIDAILGQDG